MITELMIEKGLIKRKGNRLVSCCDFGEELTLKIQELEKEIKE